MPFVFIKNITKQVKICKFSLIKLTMMKYYYYTAFHLISILCFFKDGIDKKYSSGLSSRKKLNHGIVVNGLLDISKELKTRFLTQEQNKSMLSNSLLLLNDHLFTTSYLRRALLVVRIEFP